MCFPPDAYCSHEPPCAPPGGIRQWMSGNARFMDTAAYTCPKHARFMLTDGSLVDEVTVECQWNSSWSLERLPQCVCKPFIPKGLMLKYSKTTVFFV